MKLLRLFSITEAKNQVIIYNRSCFCQNFFFRKMSLAIFDWSTLYYYIKLCLTRIVVCLDDQINPVFVTNFNPEKPRYKNVQSLELMLFSHFFF